MIALDENALICDLADSYRIYDYRSLPCKTVAALSFGLREDSRIKRKMINAKASTQEMLLAHIADRITELEWMQTKDGAKGRNRPTSLLKEMLREETEEKNLSFHSGEDFDKEWKRLSGGSEDP